MSFTINEVMFIDSCQFIQSSLDKLTSNLSKDQFRETRKYLESFYVQQPNQPQTSDVTGGEKEVETMHVHEDYRNQPPVLTSDQQQEIEQELALMTGKGVYPYEFMDSFERSKNHSYHPKTSTIDH